ncbi:MAG TPA: preprotein translocase subunit YajC [Thermoanaerobaculia bacterium]|jgi:preprotein translocase subunit YajC|nr:preprotein translocase subunit YajC [Thermoanaerobaculia bacterium]
MHPTFIPSLALALQLPSGGIMAVLSGLAPLLPVLVIFYVVLVLPMQRQRKALQQVVASLKKGDRILTSGGLYGEVTAVEGATVMLRIADNVRVRIAKSAITGLEGESDKGSQSS